MSWKFRTKNLRRLLSSLLLGFGLLGCAPANFSPEQIPDKKTENPSSEITQSFLVENAKPLTPVDVLFVIDNSRSMREEQQKLSSRLEKFTNVLSQVDWQIGITTTDVSTGPFAMDGQLVDLDFKNSKPGKSKKILDRKTQNFKAVFSDSLNKHGTPKECSDDGENCPSGYEQPLKATYKAIQKRNKENSGFFRDNADLAVIIVSDEDEEAENEDLMTPFALKAYVELQFGKSKKFNTFGIIYRPNDELCIGQDLVGGRFGINIDLMVQITDGISVSICEADYSKSLIEIGNKVTQVPYEIELSDLPKPESVKVQLNIVASGLSWTIKGKKIVFNDWPPQGTQIKVTFEKQDRN